MAHWFRSADFQEQLIRYLCRDRNFLKRTHGMLSPKDFKPNRDETDERWIIATMALEFYQKYRQPIGAMLRMEVSSFITKNRLSDERKKLLNAATKKALRKGKLAAAEAVQDRILVYLRDKRLQDALDKIVEGHEDGSLSNEKLAQICKDVLEWTGKAKRPPSKFLELSELERRISRRILNKKRRKLPLLLLDDFDTRSRGIGRGDVGLIIALYKMGKSMMLSHLADSYAKQGLKVLYYTLEDPLDEIEDRMDASIAGIPIDRLEQLPNKLRRRFKKFAKRVHGNIRIIDATEEGISIDEVELEWERQRDSGFDADVVIIDYDDEIAPPRQHKGESSRRMEFADIYRAIRRFAAKRQLIVWTAAQTKRMVEKTKIVTGDKIAEDISKIRKVTLAIGIGQGETHEDARYLWVAAHKRGRSRFGFEIMSRPAYGIAYDRDLTAREVWSKRKAR